MFIGDLSSVEGFKYNKASGLPLYIQGDLVSRYDDNQLYLVDRVLDKESAREYRFIKNIEDSWVYRIRAIDTFLGQSARKDPYLWVNESEINSSSPTTEALEIKGHISAQVLRAMNDRKLKRDRSSTTAIADLKSC